MTSEEKKSTSDQFPQQMEFNFEFVGVPLRQLLTPDEIYERADEELLRRMEEDRRIERKTAQFSGEGLGKYLCMWANTCPDGGLIVSGQRDKKNGGGFEGCKHLSDESLNKLEGVGRVFCPDARYESRRVAVTNHDGEPDFVVVFRVRYVDRMLVRTSGGKVFRRVADECVEVKNPDEIRELQADKGEISFEIQPSGLYWPDDFDLRAIDDFIAAVRAARSLGDQLTVTEILELRRLGKRTTQGFSPNIACALLFANDPQLISPGCKVRFQRFEGEREETGERYNAVKDLILEGTVPSLITQVADTLESQLRTFSPLVPRGKFQLVPEYPKLAWYEAVVNACAHRSYGNGMKNMPIFVKMFNDRIEIESPGPLPPNVTQSNIYDTHHPRNPHLMDAMFYLSYVKCAHEGTRRIRDTMLEMKLPEPEFSQSSAGHACVKVTLRNLIGQRVPSVARSSIPSSARSLSSGGADSLSGGADSLSGGADSLSGGGRDGKGGGLDNSEQEVFPFCAEIPDEVKARLPQVSKRCKRPVIRRAILELCAWRPLLPSEITRYIERASVRHVVEEYISPMFEEGLLERTIPETPSSPQQRYRTSETGLKDII